MSRLNSPFLRLLLVFFVSLLLVGLIYQIPATYTVTLGQNSDDWAVLRGYGERERNDNFAFRWTVEREAVLRLPDVGWPSRVGVVGVAPRPDNTAPSVIITAGNSVSSFTFNPASASFPPDPFGRLTFEAAGPNPTLSLNTNPLTVASQLFQPPGENRSLGIAVSQVYIKTAPGRFGLIVPPLSAWLGWVVLVALLYLLARRLTFKRPLSNLIPLATIALTLLAIAALRLFAPDWLLTNGPSLAWGASLPLILFNAKPQSRKAAKDFLITQNSKLKTQNFFFILHPSSFILLLLLSVLLVFYGVVLAPFTLTLFVVSGVGLAVLSVGHGFRRHWENVGLLISLSGGASWGLWQGQLPRTDDTVYFHMYWLNELDAIIKQGNLYPRWAVDFSWQQGNPVFNFYSPLTRYVAEIFHLLGISFSNSFMLTQFAAIALGVTGCYFWCAALLHDRRAAILGGAAFCYYPFTLADLYVGGGIANLMAGAILPYIFWQLTALVRQPRTTNPLWLGLATASLALANSPQLIIFVPLAALYLLGLLIINFAGRRGGGFPPKPVALATEPQVAGKFLGGKTPLLQVLVIKLLLAVGVTVGLSAFFLLPAVIESRQVTLSGVTANESFYAVWPDNLALWRPIFPGLKNYSLLGTLHFVLAAVGVEVWLWRGKKDGRGYAILLTGLLVLIVFLQFPVSSFFWDTFPFFASIQFSSRLMSPAIVFAAPLIAALALPGQKLKWQPYAVGLASLGLILFGCFYNLSYVYWPASFDGTLSKKALTEQIGNGDIKWLPRDLADPQTVSRYRPPTFDDNRPTGPNDNLKWEITGPDSYRLTGNVSQTARVTVPLFWYEGWWQITDDTGRSYVPTAAPLTKLVTLENIPPGQRIITVKLQDTPIRLIGNLLSLITLLGIIIIVIITRFRHRKGVD